MQSLGPLLRWFSQRCWSEQARAQIADLAQHADAELRQSATRGMDCYLECHGNGSQRIDLVLISHLSSSLAGESLEPWRQTLASLQSCNRLPINGDDIKVVLEYDNVPGKPLNLAGTAISGEQLEASGQGNYKRFEAEWCRLRQHQDAHAKAQTNRLSEVTKRLGVPLFVGLMVGRGNAIKVLVDINDANRKALAELLAEHLNNSKQVGSILEATKGWDAGCRAVASLDIDGAGELGQRVCVELFLNDVEPEHRRTIFERVGVANTESLQPREAPWSWRDVVSGWPQGTRWQQGDLSGIFYADLSSIKLMTEPRETTQLKFYFRLHARITTEEKADRDARLGAKTAPAKTIKKT